MICLNVQQQDSMVFKNKLKLNQNDFCLFVSGYSLLMTPLVEGVMQPIIQLQRSLQFLFLSQKHHESEVPNIISRLAPVNQCAFLPSC